MVELCPRCGLKFERIEGHWIGAIGINTIVSFTTLLVSLITSFVVTFPNFPVITLIVTNCGLMVVTPILFYPFSKTIWTSIDIMMRPLEPHEVDWNNVN